MSPVTLTELLAADTMVQEAAEAVGMIKVAPVVAVSKFESWFVVARARMLTSVQAMVVAVSITLAAVSPMAVEVEEIPAVGRIREEGLPAAAAGKPTLTIFQESPGSTRKSQRMIGHGT